MHFSTFVLLPIAAVMAAPQVPASTTPDLNEINRGVAETQAAINKIINSKRADIAAAVDATDPSGNTSAGIGSTLGDLTTLLSGLSDTLTGVCNLRDDIGSLTSSLGL
ncbi:hypothetical protein N0V93_010037 [Gnomoniopsis smithogilvyi]|uniref:Uncharacterized protein n=1 Tax=Gnomoniopsis smithogilvyi TaxID=1191159 RepID=A0A9W8YL80_9PEZI|nr:hypothetical protein N0V93_010037 [Gnomoniopsis smithogilvyi]